MLCSNHRSSFHALISHNSLVMFVVKEKDYKNLRISLSKALDAMRGCMITTHSRSRHYSEING